MKARALARSTARALAAAAGAGALAGAGAAAAAGEPASGGRAGADGVAAGATVAGAPRDAPACAVALSLEPARAVPGQQVRWRLRILARSDVAEIAWEDPPAFPGLRVERLPGEPFAGEELRDGARWRAQTEERALFAERAGTLRLPPATLVCRAASGEPASVATPELALEVAPFPEAARPAGFRGLVGPIALRQRVTPREIRLGESVRVELVLQGDTNLWDAALPRDLSVSGAEVFAERERTELEPGPRLLVRRHLALEIVPREAGLQRIPALAWAFFDPASGRYGEAASEAVAVRVAARAAPPSGAVTAQGAAAPALPRPPTAAPPPRLRGPLGLAAAAALLIAIAVRAARTRLRRRALARAVGAALSDAALARERGDPDRALAAAARALRAAIEARPAAPAPPLAEAARLLAQLERARFDPAAERPEAQAVERALAALGIAIAPGAASARSAGADRPGARPRAADQAPGPR